MIVKRVSQNEVDQLFDPGESRWLDLNDTIHVELSPTPLAMQPTKAIRASWEKRKYGLIEAASFSAVHDGTHVLIRIAWKDPHKDDRVEDNGDFVDKMALMFPLTENAVMFTMGSETDPVELWRWNADGVPTRHINATGIGRTVDVKNIEIESHGVWRNGEWQVVLKRKMETNFQSTKTFSIGEACNCGLAIWAGHNQERGGIKSISMRWIPLEIA